MMTSLQTKHVHFSDNTSTFTNCEHEQIVTVTVVIVNVNGHDRNITWQSLCMQINDHFRAWKLKEGHPTCDLLTHSEIQDAVDQVNAEQQRANATAIPEQAIVNFQV